MLKVSNITFVYNARMEVISLTFTATGSFQAKINAWNTEFLIPENITCKEKQRPSTTSTATSRFP